MRHGPDLRDRDTPPPAGSPFLAAAAPRFAERPACRPGELCEHRRDPVRADRQGTGRHQGTTPARMHIVRRTALGRPTVTNRLCGFHVLCQADVLASRRIGRRSRTPALADGRARHVRRRSHAAPLPRPRPWPSGHASAHTSRTARALLEETGPNTRRVHGSWKFLTLWRRAEPASRPARPRHERGDSTHSAASPGKRLRTPVRISPARAPCQLPRFPRRPPAPTPAPESSAPASTGNL